jgi:hypothetical protein
VDRAIFDAVEFLVRHALISMTLGPFGPQNGYFVSKTTGREKSPDRLAKEPVTSELLSGLEQGKIQGKLGTLGDFLGHFWPKPIHHNGVVWKIQKQRPSPIRE